MPRKLKVHCTMVIRSRDMTPLAGHEHVRQIMVMVATPTKKAAAELFCTPYSSFTWRYHDYDEGTPEYELAASNPGVVFWREDHVGGPEGRVWKRWENQEVEQEKFRRSAERSAENKVRRAERQVQYQADRERRQECNEAAVMWSRRLSDDFGLSNAPADNGQVDVVVPAEYLHGLLTEVSGILRDMGVDDLLQSNESEQP